MDEATNQSWVVADSQPPSFPNRTVLMETSEVGYFSSSNVIESRDANFADKIKTETMLFSAGKVGQPKECSTPTKYNS